MKINKVKNGDENLQHFIYAIYKHKFYIKKTPIFADLENIYIKYEIYTIHKKL